MKTSRGHYFSPTGFAPYSAMNLFETPLKQTEGPLLSSANTESSPELPS